MGITSIVNGKTIKAEDHLAFQMKLHLGVEVDPAKLKDFIQSKWVALSHLAHSIHADMADRPEVEAEIVKQFAKKKKFAEFPGTPFPHRGGDINDNAGIPVA